jgi:hypothetical protein
MPNNSIFAPPKKTGTVLDSVAQLVEHNTFNVGVLGSNPSGITKTSPTTLLFLG